MGIHPDSRTLHNVTAFPLELTAITIRGHAAGVISDTFPFWPETESPFCKSSTPCLLFFFYIQGKEPVPVRDFFSEQMQVAGTLRRRHALCQGV